MAIWLPGATREPAAIDGGSMLGGPPRLVWHSTEGTSAAGAIAAMRTARSWAHLTATYERRRFQVFQHLPLDRAARALRHPAAGVDTNRMGRACVQVEVVGFAARIGELPDGYLAGLAQLARQVEHATGIPRRSTVAWLPYPASYGLANGVRLAAPAWRAYSGHLGHQHVPGNQHGDPGAINIAAILTTGDPTMADAQDILDAIAKLRQDLTVFGSTGLEDSIEDIAARQRQALERLDAIQARLDAAGVPAGPLTLTGTVELHSAPPAAS